jgi:hypothetical protein
MMMLIMMVLWFKACTVLKCLNSGILISNPTWSMVISFFFSVCVLSYVGRGLAMGESPVQGFLLNF